MKRKRRKYTNSSEKDSGHELNNLKSLGDLIKEGRLALNMSREELANILKVGEEQLIALEEGNKELLPELVYIKAMIRRVAEKLKLDGDLLIKTLQEDNPVNGEIVENKDWASKNSNKNRVFQRFRVSLLIAIPTILLTFIGQKYISNLDRSITKNTPEQSLIFLSSIKPSKVKVISISGLTLFEGIIRKPLSYPPNQIKEIYAEKPNLILVKSSNGQAKKLNKMSSLTWYKLKSSGR